jgi:hypothetical protein
LGAIECLSSKREQIEQAIAVMREYLNAPRTTDGLTLPEHEKRLDEQRMKVIEVDLKPPCAPFWVTASGFGNSRVG